MSALWTKWVAEIFSPGPFVLDSLSAMAVRQARAAMHASSGPAPERVVPSRIRLGAGEWGKVPRLWEVSELISEGNTRRDEVADAAQREIEKLYVITSAPRSIEQIHRVERWLARHWKG